VLAHALPACIAQTSREFCVDTAFWSAAKLIRALRAKKIGALELLEREYYAFTPPPVYA
jgi:hypothetical protein